MVIFKVLLIGGSTGTMLEALQVVGDSNRYHQLYEVSSFAVCNNKDKAVLFFCKRFTHMATLQSLGLCTSPLVVGSSAEGLYKDALVICREIYKHFRGCNHHGVDLFWCLQVDHMATCISSLYTMRVTDGLCIIIGRLAKCRRIPMATTLVTWDKITMKDHPLQANSNRNLEI